MGRPTAALFCALLLTACAGPSEQSNGDEDDDQNVESSDTGDMGVPDDTSVPDDVDEATDGTEASDDGVGETDAEVTAAAQRYAEAFCDWALGCGEDFVWEFAYGGREECVERLTSSDWFLWDGVTVGVTGFDACSMALDQASCDELPAECTFHGERTNGEECEGRVQCESGFCRFDDREALCGECHAVTVEGDDCLVEETSGGPRSFCVGGLRCGTDETCWEPVAPGGLCDPEPCDASGDCIDGTCVARGTLGEPCSGVDETLPGCDVAAGFWCDTVNEECVEIVLADVGESCQSGNGLTLCRGAASCRFTEAEGRICMELEPVGGDCDGRQDCEDGLRCVDGTCTERTCGS